MELEDAERQENEPAVELAKVHVSQQAQDIYRPGRDAIVRKDTREDAPRDKVSDGDALLPGHRLGSEALVGEALGGILQRVARGLEVDEVGGRVGGDAAGLVRVVEGREPAEARLDVAVGGGEGHAQVRVEGSLAAKLVVGLVNGVGEVERHNEDVDVAAVAVEPRAAGSGFRVAGADCETIVDGLDPRCGNLWFHVVLRVSWVSCAVKMLHETHLVKRQMTNVWEERPPYDGQELRHDLSSSIMILQCVAFERK